MSPGNLVPRWGLRHPTTSGSKDEMAPLAGSGQRLEKQKDKKGPWELALLGFTPPAWPQARPPGSLGG